MAIVPQLCDFVSETFDQLQLKYSLFVVEINDNEVGIYGDGYVVLIWVDRDGFSAMYADLGSNGNLKVINMVNFFVMDRRWHSNLVDPPDDTYTSIVHSGVVILKKTLQLEGQDILRGDKDWLADVTQTPFELSESHSEEIRSAIREHKRSLDKRD